jgi:serine protease Do
MQKGLSVLISAAAGAVAGVIVVLVVFNSPQAARFFGGGAVPQQSTELTGEAPSVGNAPDEGVSQHESSVINAVKKADPAVVSVVITKDVPIIEQYYEDLPANPLSPFGNFFTPFQLRTPQYRQRGTQQQEVGGGSGFLVSPDGMILTNRHVVDQNDVEYTVFTNDGTKYAASVVARDPANDLAIIHIDGSDLPYLELADMDHLQVGQTVIAIGNALSEFRNTVSVGVISGLSRSILAGDGQGQSEQLEEVIQTDAAINPGNSGGPLLNLSGQVVGVNVAVALGTENIGFALPVDIAKDVVTSVQETGRIVRPFLGVRYAMITPAIQEQNSLLVDYGALLLRGETQTELAVVPGSPADKAGLEEGDIILEIDGVSLKDGTTLAGQIRTKKVDDTLVLKVLHEGAEQTVNVTLAENPS